MTCILPVPCLYVACCAVLHWDADCMAYVCFTIRQFDRAHHMYHVGSFEVTASYLIYNFT